MSSFCNGHTEHRGHALEHSGMDESIDFDVTKRLLVDSSVFVATSYRFQVGLKNINMLCKAGCLFNALMYLYLRFFSRNTTADR